MGVARSHVILSVGTSNSIVTLWSVANLRRVGTYLRVGYGRRRWSTAGGPAEVQQPHLARRTAVD